MDKLSKNAINSQIYYQCHNPLSTTHYLSLILLFFSLPLTIGRYKRCYFLCYGYY